MEKLEMLYEGKAKKVYKTDNKDLYVVEYKDDATAFDGAKKGKISGKGVVNNKISSVIFTLIEKKGVPTHFVKYLSETEQLVKAVEIVPLEVIIRNVAAGSISKRLGIEEGTKLSETVLEFCYKNDDFHDPIINEYHARVMGLASTEELEKIKEYTFKINEILVEFFKEKGLNLIDFKVEFGRHNGEIILADEISPDTCRLWDMETNEKMDKDRFRRDLGKVEETYREVLSRIE
ncbi:phosphoribosylaminoimidazolesuccinocarboxamide synthase [Alkalibacter saccharofermentans]|uniref:Phosphoribosylaminoimidazole-succinocarboxamide synthase n=1 Tax=Alkalibacter saccharofermentans DSM 14828 TaxID=1120975 RepID=A0A1M4YD65_9FIRM|nr:phosphoribosylaminoimidazolesuccinocarboxamide synthase [Alkalibacter saccharofermentans]SHF03781.1 phosphoribosylaminoimidazole-succinocarboxamide synthase [Alkalibacter saccharofermentans DSM 14828]